MIRYHLWNQHNAHHNLDNLLEFYLRHKKVLFFWLLYLTSMYKPTELSVSGMSQGSGINKIRLLYFSFDTTVLHVYPRLPFSTI